MSEVRRKNPIDVISYFQSAAVFAIYGVVTTFVAVLLEWHSTSSAASKLTVILMEPVSMYSYAFLMLGGLFGLTLLYGIYPSSKKLGESKLARWVFAPMANAGLSAGAIIIGMLTGVGLVVYGHSAAACYFECSSVSRGDMKFGADILKLALVMFMQVAGIALFTHGLFVETRAGKKLMLISTFIYCAFVLASLWALARQAFSHALITVLIGAAIFFMLVVCRWARRGEIDWLA